MENKIIDAFGLQCPKPLVLAKKELDAGVTDLAVQVDNETAVKNLTRLGSKKGMAAPHAVPTAAATPSSSTTMQWARATPSSAAIS